MIHNDQVHDEPVAGDSGEIRKNATQEDKSSSSVSPDKKEETTEMPETQEAAPQAARDQEQDSHVPKSPAEMPVDEPNPEPKL